MLKEVGDKIRRTWITLGFHVTVVEIELMLDRMLKSTLKQARSNNLAVSISRYR
jgi:hypothetical protein